MQSIHVWGPAELHALLALVGPIALRVKAIAPVVPTVVASVARPDDAAAQLQQQLLGGGAGERVGDGVGWRFRGVGVGSGRGGAQLDHQLFGFSAGEDGVDARETQRKVSHKACVIPNVTGTTSN